MARPTLVHSAQRMSCLRHSKYWRLTHTRAAARPHQAHLLSMCGPATVPGISTTFPHLQPVSSRLKAPYTFTFSTQRRYISTNMSSFEKITRSEGDGSSYPKPGDYVTMEYTGWLYDPSKPDKKGNQFDSSVGRGDFRTKIGTGQVIQGWDQGVPQMSLGEKATLIIPGHMAYGDRGYPGLIPKNATLMFDVHLKKIN